MDAAFNEAHTPRSIVSKKSSLVDLLELESHAGWTALHYLCACEWPGQNAPAQDADLRVQGLDRLVAINSLDVNRRGGGALGLAPLHVLAHFAIANGFPEVPPPKLPRRSPW
jgi:hypothetical protein